MTFETPLHAERSGLDSERHGFDLTVTAYAAHPATEVDAVIEIDEIRKIIHPLPGDGRSVPKTLPDRFQHGSVLPDLSMAAHAGFRRRHSRRR